MSVSAGRPVMRSAVVSTPPTLDTLSLGATPTGITMPDRLLPVALTRMARSSTSGVPSSSNTVRICPGAAVALML